MKILKAGIPPPPNEKTYTATCHSCKCKFEFKAREGKVRFVNQEVLIEVGCPQHGCHNDVKVLA